jgi:hypothetical protein
VDQHMCVENDCTAPVYARWLCSRHYKVWIWAGIDLPPHRIDTSSWHRLSGVDLVGRTASCSICGPVTIKVRHRTRDGGRARSTCNEMEKARKRAALRGTGRDSRLRGRYGITESDYDAMLAAQGGVCWICKEPPSRIRLAVDHDHDCCPGGKSCGECVRGLLCTPCNTLLGRVKDGEWLAEAKRYLDRA